MLQLIIIFAIAIPIVFAIRIIAQILENKIYYMKDSPKKKLFKILFDVAAIIILVIICAIWYYIRDNKQSDDNKTENTMEQTTEWWLVGDIPIEESNNCLWRMSCNRTPKEDHVLNEKFRWDLEWRFNH